MASTSYDLHGMRVLECAPDGKKLRTDRDATDVIGEAFSQKADLVLIPVDRFEDDFFRLSTRIAGEMIQKFVNYRRRVAIIGDISRHLAESSSLRDFVRETNRGDQVWFLATMEELNMRLERRASLKDDSSTLSIKPTTKEKP